MSELVRFGVAMDRGLLAEFDRRIAGQGYENRSEALRDLVRADLTRAGWAEGAVVAATITVVCDHRARDTVGRLTEEPDDHKSLVSSSMHVHLDGERCLEVIVVRGRAPLVAALAGRISGARGVLSCELTVAATLRPATEAPGGGARP